MKKFFKKVLYVLLWTWQLPQNICGLFAILLWRNEPNFSKHVNWYDKKGFSKIYRRNSIANVTFGEYINVYHRSNKLDEIVRHETGHVYQSRILGPLYLPVIGLTSGLLCSFCNYQA